MNNNIKIGSKTIKNHGEVFIIAEAGVNHNGDYQKALDLIDVAADSEADAIKFQTFKAEQVVTNRAKMATYQIANTTQNISQKEMLKQFELQESFYEGLINRCQAKNIIFLSTPHGGVESVDFLEQFNLPAYKVGSADVTNYLLLQKLSLLKKPIILSTGMATLQEVKLAVDFIQKNGNNSIALLHCTTSYPCPIDEVNLKVIQTLMKEFESLPIGYSDHTLGNQVGIMAATMGISIYECHFTLDKKLQGPDHAASADTNELKDKVKSIRQVSTILGKNTKEPTDSEKIIMNNVRKSLVASKNLVKGSVLKEEDLKAKRPGDGTSPIEYKTVLGKKLKRNLQKDEQIIEKDLL